MSTTTWQTLFPAIARLVYADKSIIDITATGGSSTTVVDGTNAYTSRSANAYDGAGLFCYNGTTAAPARPENEFRRVTSGGFAGSTGTFTVAPAFGVESGTSTATDATTMTDTTKAWTVNEWAGAIVNMPGTPGGTMTVTSNTATILTGAAWSSAGDPTDALAYTMAVAVEAGDKFILMRGGLDHNQFLDAANDVITAHAWPQYLAATLIVDGNFTATDPATGWADVTGTPTQTAEATLVLTGKQSMKVVYTVVDTSVGCAAVPVVESEGLLVWAPVKCTAGSLRVQLWDNTNGAEIDGVTVDEEAWVVVVFTASVPDNCQNVSVRLVNKTAATTAYIDHVGLLSQNRELYTVIPEITDASHIERALSMPLITPGEASQSYLWGEKLETWPGGEALKDYFAVNAQRATLQRPSLHPIFWQFRAYESPLTGLTSTTVAPTDVVEFGTAAELLERWANRLDGTERGKKLAQAGKYREVYATVMASIQLNRPTVTFHSTRVQVPS